jgi:hypothetical protein
MGGATATGAGNEALVDINNTGDFEVKATLDVPKSVTVEVYDLVDVDCPLPDHLSAKRWKGYKSNQVTRLKATTKPDEARVWKHLLWSEGAPTGTKQESDVELKPVGDRTVTVSLGGKPLQVDLHICQWPVLKIEAVKFDAVDVLNDGDSDFGSAFDNAWEDGRPDPAPHVDAADCQSPLCFEQGNTFRAGATFWVQVAPTDNETVTIRGTGNFGELTAVIAIDSTDLDSLISTPDMLSTNPLPDQVDCVDNWTIAWEYKLQDGSWADAGSTTHLLYLTLGAPQADVYFTLLDISCRAAAGKDTEDDLVAFSFVPFTTHTDDNNGFRRKGDDKRLTYYLDGVDTPADDNTYTTEGILGSADATGRCGGWASLLIHMWKIHGVTTATQRWFVRATATNFADMMKRFLVKNIDFSAVGTLPGRYPYQGAAGLKLNGAPGQGKKNPQFDFGDHVIVKHGGRLYDPSYGLGPFTTDKLYLAQALAGIGTAATTAGVIPFTMTDGTKQFISDQCAPYANGFASYTIKRQTLADIAAEFGVTDVQLLALDPALRLLRATPAHVVPGDTVVIPIHADESIDLAATAGYRARKVLQEVTLNSITAAHGATAQAIFDDPANAALKLLRLTPAGVQNGDTIVVTPASVPNGDWVIGHDR